jgi:hypothetical protein
MMNLADAFKHSRKLEERETKFKIVTQISVEDAMQWFQAMGKFPDKDDIYAIRIFGIQKSIELCQHTVLVDKGRAVSNYPNLQQLPVLKKSFKQAFKDVFKRFFKK